MPEKEKEEYELIAVSPLRRLEKRIEELESTAPPIDVKEIFREIVDIVRMNQQLVDELIKSNDSLKIELAKLPSRIEELINDLNELISFIKASAGEEGAVAPSGESFKPLADKLDVLIDTNRKIIENNQAVLSALEEIDKKLRRPSSPPPMHMRRPPLLTKTL